MEHQHLPRTWTSIPATKTKAPCTIDCSCTLHEWIHRFYWRVLFYTGHSVYLDALADWSFLRIWNVSAATWRSVRTYRHTPTMTRNCICSVAYGTGWET